MRKARLRLLPKPDERTIEEIMQSIRRKILNNYKIDRLSNEEQNDSLSFNEKEIGYLHDKSN